MVWTLILRLAGWKRFTCNPDQKKQRTEKPEMEKTKVIEFVQTMGDGGAETLVKDYALLMDRERFEITVVVLHAMEDSANLQRLREANVPVIALSGEDDILKRIWRRIFWKKEKPEIRSEDVQQKPVLPGSEYNETGFLRSCRNAVRNLYFGLRFLRVVKQTGATVVHAHLDLLGCLRSVSGALKGVKLFHTCHALPELIYEGDEGDSARYLIRHNGLQLIALHGSMAEQMDAMFPEQKTKVIRNGINIAMFQNPQVSREEKRRELSIPQDAYVVGHVGRFTPEKNHPFLVEVFREITERKENAYLLMIGAEDSSHIEKKLKQYGLQNRYQILSHRRDISELLGAMDVFVFPSIFEGFSVALIEAQAAGLRCVVSENCPPKAIRTEICIPMPLGSPEAWAETALDESIRRNSARSLWEYDMNREIRRLEDLYYG